ncbi:hypothetical protein H2200_000674 [Cladophialophora chaetospira]|uniref:Hsp70 family chaperone n=1 Tax=Cladophialophora chaetospira TaxID=386627 RepID=A0AA38XNZ7_9EURO|nr:hypothetical protein H2200_000674 [Cladophialophora chaetospira]
MAPGGQIRATVVHRPKTTGSHDVQDSSEDGAATPGRQIRATVVHLPKTNRSQALRNSGVSKQKKPTTTTKASSIIRAIEQLEGSFRRRTILFGLDCGTEFIKASYYVSTENDTNDQPVSTKEVHTVNWPNNSPIVRARAAFDNDGNLRLASDVDSAVRDGKVQSCETIGHLKPMLYEDRMKVERSLVLDKLWDPRTALVDALGSFEITPQLAACGETVPLLHDEDASKDNRAQGSQPHSAGNTSPREVPHFEIYARLMGWAFREAASYVSTKHDDLNWQRAKDENSPLAGHNVRVALLVPSKSTVTSREHVVAAARAAGIPNFFLVREAAAALACHLVRCLENVNAESLVGKTFIMLDWGAGSVDLEVWKILSLSPLRVQARYKTQSEWNGARTANTHAEKLVLNGVRDMEELLDSMSLARGRTVTQKDAGAEIREEFEMEKRFPNGIEARLLKIRGLPTDKDSRLHGDAGVRLDEDDNAFIQESTTEPVSYALYQCMHWLNFEASKPQGSRIRIDGIVGTGGGVLNAYARQKLREDIEKHCHSLHQGITIPVHFPELSSTYASLTQTASGGVLLLADGESTSDRIVERSYFSLRYKGNNAKVVYFVRKDHTLDATGVKVMLDTRMLPQDENEGLKLKEDVFYSETIKKRGVSLDQQQIKDLDKLVICHHLTKEELRFIPQVSSPTNPWSTSRDYYKFQSSLEMTFEGQEACFTTTIPRNGTFGYDEDPGDNPIVKKARIDFRGILRSVGAIVEGEKTAIDSFPEGPPSVDSEDEEAEEGEEYSWDSGDEDDSGEEDVDVDEDMEDDSDDSDEPWDDEELWRHVGFS